MKLNSILYMFLNVASLTSAAGDGTIRGGGLADGFNDDGRNLKEDINKDMIEPRDVDFLEKAEESDDSWLGKGNDDSSKGKDKEYEDFTKDDGGNK